MKEERVLIDVYREALIEELSNKDVKSPIKLPVSPGFFKEILFDREKKGYDYCYTFCEKMKPILSYFDFSDISFDNVDIRGVDFSNLKGVKINPQRVYDKSFYNTTCRGVQFESRAKDMFDGVKLGGSISDDGFTDFTGSKGAVINPLTIYEKNLIGVICSDVTFSPPNGLDPIDYDIFWGVNISRTNFSGSKGVMINPQTIAYKSLYKTVCNGVKFIGSFDDVELREADFTGSTGAIINPSTIRNNNMTNAILNGVKFEGEFWDTNVAGANFTGSTGAKIIPSNLKKDLRKTVFNGVVFNHGVFLETDCRGTDFTGSKGAEFDPSNNNFDEETNFCDVTITNKFENVDVNNLKLEGSNYGKTEREKAKQDIKQLIKSFL